VNSLAKTVTRQCRSCDLNPDPSVPESITLTTRLLSHPDGGLHKLHSADDVAVNWLEGTVKALVRWID